MSEICDFLQARDRGGGGKDEEKSNDRTHHHLRFPCIHPSSRHSKCARISNWNETNINRLVTGYYLHSRGPSPLASPWLCVSFWRDDLCVCGCLFFVPPKEYKNHWVTIYFQQNLRNFSIRQQFVTFFFRVFCLFGTCHGKDSRICSSWADIRVFVMIRSMLVFQITKNLN